jgi:hypothetical protein
MPCFADRVGPADQLAPEVRDGRESWDIWDVEDVILSRECCRVPNPTGDSEVRLLPTLRSLCRLVLLADDTPPSLWLDKLSSLEGLRDLSPRLRSKRLPILLNMLFSASRVGELAPELPGDPDLLRA